MHPILCGRCKRHPCLNLEENEEVGFVIKMDGILISGYTRSLVQPRDSSPILKRKKRIHVHHILPYQFII
jgi:hypothetical protein